MAMLSRKSIAVAVALTALAAGSAGADNRKGVEVVRAQLVGFQEVPTLSSPGHGSFRAIVDQDAGTITYWLTYDGLPTAIQQSHLHLGQHHTAGGISVFLCTNLNNSPGVQACPAPPAQISGVISASDVIGPTAQGIGPGEFAELLTALRSGSVYVNVHTAAFPAGEIRGQLR
jgi:hypothetical protein